MRSQTNVMHKGRLQERPKRRESIEPIRTDYLASPDVLASAASTAVADESNQNVLIELRLHDDVDEWPLPKRDQLMCAIGQLLNIGTVVITRKVKGSTILTFRMPRTQGAKFLKAIQDGYFDQFSADRRNSHIVDSPHRSNNGPWDVRRITPENGPGVDVYIARGMWPDYAQAPVRSHLTHLPIHMVIQSRDGAFVEALADTPVVWSHPGLGAPEIGAPVRVPAAIGSWYELPVRLMNSDLSAVAIANWIKSAARDAETATLKLKLRKGVRRTEADVVVNDGGRLTSVIQRAFKSVDPDE